LRITQAWPETPSLFRDQFLSIFSDEDLQEDVLDGPFLNLEQIGNWLASGQSVSSEELIRLGNFLFQLGEHFRQIGDRSKVVAIRHQLYSEQHLDRVLKRIKDSIGYDPRTGHDHHSRRSFLGTADQWDKLLAWEANGQNAYLLLPSFFPS
jgi:hypothetical protein